MDFPGLCPVKISDPKLDRRLVQKNNPHPPGIDDEVLDLFMDMVRENPAWGDEAVLDRNLPVVEEVHADALGAFSAFDGILDEVVIPDEKGIQGRKLFRQLLEKFYVGILALFIFHRPLLLQRDSQSKL
jgi:hypothetical protein